MNDLRNIIVIRFRSSSYHEYDVKVIIGPELDSFFNIDECYSVQNLQIVNIESVAMESRVMTKNMHQPFFRYMNISDIDANIIGIINTICQRFFDSQFIDPDRPFKLKSSLFILDMNIDPIYSTGREQHIVKNKRFVNIVSDFQLVIAHIFDYEIMDIIEIIFSVQINPVVTDVINQ